MALTKSITIGIAIFVLTLHAVYCVHGRRGNEQLRQLRPTRGFKEMELAAARNFGKRAINMHVMNGIIMKWIALENKMKEWNMQRERNLPPLDPLCLLAGDAVLPNNNVLIDE